MPTARTNVTSSWQKVADAGETFTIQVLSGTVLVAFKASSPTSDDDAFVIKSGDGCNNTFGPATDNCYVKRKRFKPSVIVCK